VARSQVDISYFDKWNPNINYSINPEMYHIGRGQQGVLICEPYKSEICQFWRFKTPNEAAESSKHILKMFYEYVENDDFVGADMAKKFLHMGFTRSRRYANHRDGKKYNDDGSIIPQELDAMSCSKAESARIFYACWKEARTNSTYLQMKKQHRSKYGH